jgi:outer membrane autotransporter protein
MKTFAVVISAGVLVLSAASVRAQNPDLCSAHQPAQCLNGVSASVTSFDAMRIGVVNPRDWKEEEKKKKQAGIARIRLAASETLPGLLSPDTGGWGLWAGYGRSRFEGTVPVAPYDARLDSLRLGMDRLFAGRYVLGAALVLDRLDTTTRFNGGGQDADTTTLAPYFTVIINDTLSLDFNAGWGRTSASQSRIDPASVPGLPSILRADFDAHRIFGSATLNAIKPAGNWVFGGRAGYLHSREDQDAYQETGGPSARAVRERNLKLGQLYAGGDATYRLGGNFEAYGGGLFRRDTTRDDGSSAGGLPNAVGNPQPGDRTEWEWTLGLRFFASPRVTFGAEWLKTTGRDRFKHHGVNLLLRLDL